MTSYAANHSCPFKTFQLAKPTQQYLIRDWPTERRSCRGQEDDTANYVVCIKAIWVVVARESLACWPLHVMMD